MALFQSPGIVPLLLDISSNRASYEIMAFPPIFSMSPGMSSGPTDLFLLIIANHFLIILVLTVKGSYTCDVFISAMSRSQLNTEDHEHIAYVPQNMNFSGPDDSCHHTRIAVRYIRNQEVN